jgi:hypothetical protein
MTKDKLIANIMQRMALRSENGIKKFGLTMGETKKPTVAWIDDAQEELWDAIVYLEKVKLIMRKEIEESKESYGGTL